MVLRRKLIEEAQNAEITKTLKILCVCTSHDTEIKMRSIKDKIDAERFKLTLTNNEDYLTKDPITEYDVAIFALLENEEKIPTDTLELEESRNMIEYYLNAPITALLTTREDLPIPYDAKSVKHKYFIR